MAKDSVNQDYLLISAIVGSVCLKMQYFIDLFFIFTAISFSSYTLNKSFKWYIVYIWRVFRKV